ncbi:hypothetical protein BB561_006510, partial [Smittium simulii]
MDDLYDYDNVDSEKSFSDDNNSFMGYDEEVDDDGTHGLVKAVVSIEDDTSLP